jgi:hypothetical protein
MLTKGMDGIGKDGIQSLPVFGSDHQRPVPPTQLVVENVLYLYSCFESRKKKAKGGRRRGKHVYSSHKFIPICMRLLDDSYSKA